MATVRTSEVGWLLDEVGNAGRENLDENHVARYDRIEDADAVSEVQVLANLGLGSPSVVVEVGAGTGQFTLRAAECCARVVAVDISPPMLELLRSKIGDHANIEVVEAGFLTYEHHGPPADFIYSRYAMHHLPDFWKGVALARLHNMLKPGGVLRVWDVVYNFSPANAEQQLEAWCRTGADDGADAWTRGDYEEHVRDEHSTFTWAFEAIAVRAGFLIEEAEYSGDGIFAKYVFRRPTHAP